MSEDIVLVPCPKSYEDYSLCMIFGSFMVDPATAGDIDVLYYNMKPDEVWRCVGIFLDMWGLSEHRSKKLDCTKIEVKNPPTDKNPRIEYYLPLVIGQPIGCCVIHSTGEFSVSPKYITNRLTSVLKTAKWLANVDVEYISNYMVRLLTQPDVAISFEPPPKKSTFYKKIDNYCDNRDSLIKAVTTMPVDVEFALKQKLSWYDVISNMCLYPVRSRTVKTLRSHDSRRMAMLYTHVASNGEVTFRTSDHEKFYTTNFIVNYFFNKKSKLSAP